MTKKTTDRAAKFYGECQLCAHQQKLPGDRLSIHGYSVQWNCFVGTCPGSRYLPFEVSKDLLADSIARSKAEAIRLREYATEVRASRDPKAVYLHIYSSDVRTAEKNERVGTYGFFGAKSSSAEVVGDLSKVADGFEFRFRRGDEYVVALGLRSGYHSTDKLDDVVAKLRGKQADGVVRTAENHERYVVWQTARMKNWKPRDLKPVPEAERGSKPTIHIEFKHYRSGIGCRFSSNRMGGSYFHSSPDWSKVTCASCLKKRAELAEAAKRFEERAAEKAKARKVSYERDGVKRIGVVERTEPYLVVREQGTNLQVQLTGGYEEIK